MIILLPGENFCGPDVLSYQNESPFFNLKNWSPIKQVRSGPMMPPFTGYSAKPPV
jgi:hypothetical protein